MTANTAQHLTAARRADSDRRRSKVTEALNRLHAEGGEITVSAVARAAGVDRSFLYRHHDLRTQILQQADQPETPASPRTSTRSLLADLANLRAHNERLRQHNAKLTQRLSEVLGDDAFRTAGLTEPDNSQALRTQLTNLEQQLLDCRQDLQDRDDELAAARAANRDLMTAINSPTRQPSR